MFLKILILTYLSLASGPSDVCKDWFLRDINKINPQDCKLSCATLPTNLETSSCPLSCTDLCDYNKMRSLAGRAIYYPGLNLVEADLVKKYPFDAIVVFIQKTRAEFATSSRFPDGFLNDESDAFRHFLWSGLMTFRLGRDKAKLFADAHETDPMQPVAERAMDHANNMAGILGALKLMAAGRATFHELEKLALEELRRENLIVIKPGLSIPRDKRGRLQGFQIAQFLENADAEKKWGRVAFKPEEFRSRDHKQRAAQAVDIVVGNKLVGKEISEVRGLLGEPDGYLFSEAIIGYAIGSTNEWQIVFLRSKDFKTVSQAKIHRKCCFKKPAWLIR